MFTQEVIEQLQYYVYRLIDPRDGQTFYVGKGKDNRLFAHISDALRNYNGENYTDGEDDEISEKIKQIREIKNAGLEVLHVIQRYGLTKNEALEVEAALIDCYPGLTNIQSGYSAERGVNNADLLQKNLSLKEFQDRDDIKYCIIKITNRWLDVYGTVYETVRKHWRVDLNRIQTVPYVVASLNGVVVDVFEVEKWYRADDVPDRCMFDGKQAPDEIRDWFINKKLPQRYIKKGVANPVLYHD